MQILESLYKLSKDVNNEKKKRSQKMKKVKENVKEKKEINRISTRYSLSSKIKDSRAGITLIALVISIIVLLILAGVTIATLTGDNRAHNKSCKSKLL